MTRIAATLLIVAATLVLNGVSLRDVMAAERVPQPTAAAVDIAQPTLTQNSKLLSLLMILESLRQAPGLLDGQKV
jgi:hypothetical protein